MDYLEAYNSEINHVLHPLEFPYIQSFLKLFLVMYGGMIAPKLPTSVLKMFDLPPVKITALFLIVWTSTHDPAIALLIAFALFTSLNVLSGRKAFESFTQVKHDK